MSPAAKRKEVLRELTNYRAGLRQKLEQYYALDIGPPPRQFSSHSTSLSGSSGSGSLEVAKYSHLSVIALLEHIDKVRGDKCSREEVNLSFDYSCANNECNGSGGVEVSFSTDKKIEDPLWAEKIKIWEEEKALAPETRRVALEASEREALNRLKKQVQALENKLEKK